MSSPLKDGKHEHGEFLEDEIQRVYFTWFAMIDTCFRRMHPKITFVLFALVSKDRKAMQR